MYRFEKKGGFNMDNFEHEITCPENKGIRNYLWYDYFHDSKIVNVFFDHKKGIVILTLQCCREIEEMWNRLTGSNEIRRTYIDENNDSFIYYLTFIGTKYYHCERLIMDNDYINGRFKDTALLRKLVAENVNQLYHFRIQVDHGYIDIIFSGFIIRKKVGRVKFPVKETNCRTCKRFGEEAIKVALDGDDFDRFLAMETLFHENDSALLEIARQNLWFDDDGFACLYSTYILGKLGNADDIPKLLKLYLKIEQDPMFKLTCRCSAILPKRNILDAIELIYQRNADF
jgi:hypothetical protein